MGIIRRNQSLLLSWWTFLAICAGGLICETSAAQSLRLEVVKEGRGDGAIGGNLIDCPPGCPGVAVDIDLGTPVQLSGLADQDSEFLGFMGPTCFGTNTCTFTMTEDLFLVAGFSRPEPFGITHSRPVSGDTTVDPTNLIRVYFNRDIVEGPGFGEIELSQDGTPVPINRWLVPASRLLVVDPVSSMSAGLEIRLHVAVDAVVAAGGEFLQEAFEMDFEIRDTSRPELHSTVYPAKVPEGGRALVSLWFDRPTSHDRWIQLQISDPSAVTLPGSGDYLLPANERLLEIDVETIPNHGSVEPRFITVQFSEADAGVSSASLEIVNGTRVFNSSLKWDGVRILFEDDGDGIFEAGETADLELTVENVGTEDAFGVVLDLQVLNSSRLDILGGTPFRCQLGVIRSGEAESCLESFRANDELPTGGVLVEILGTSSLGGFVDHSVVEITNNDRPDYQLLGQAFSESSRLPGSEVIVDYVARNSDDGFELMLPGVEIEIGDLPFERFETYANVRGDGAFEDVIELAFAAPDTPGAYPIRAMINPPSADRLDESDYDNNESVEFVLNVEGAPVIDPIDGQWQLTVGEPFAYTVTASDPNEDDILFSLGNGAPQRAEIDPQTGVFSWTPDCTAIGSLSFEILASDGNLKPDSEEVETKVGLVSDLELTVVGGGEVLPGQAVHYSVLIRNLGPSCIESAIVSYQGISQLSAMSWHCRASAGSSCPGDQGNSLREEMIDILAGGVVEFVVTEFLASSAQGVLHGSHQVLVPKIAVDPNRQNNQQDLILNVQ